MENRKTMPNTRQPILKKIIFLLRIYMWGYMGYIKPPTDENRIKTN